MTVCIIGPLRVPEAPTMVEAERKQSRKLVFMVKRMVGPRK